MENLKAQNNVVTKLNVLDPTLSFSYWSIPLPGCEWSCDSSKRHIL